MNAQKDTTYNGWTNYETWAVKLWIDNEQGSYNYWREIAQEMWNESTPGEYEWQTREQQFIYALSERLKDEHEENTPKVDGIYADLLSAAMSEVNWSEIAKTYLEDIDRTEDSTDEDAE